MVPSSPEHISQIEMIAPPVERLLASRQIADSMIDASQSVLEAGMTHFAQRLTEGKPRHAGRTLGGSVLGSSIDRDEFKAEPQSLLEPVRERLTDIISSSSDPEQKQLNSQRNARDVRAGGGFWKYGDLVHSTSFQSLEGILNTGLVCSELQGEFARIDTTPLEADLSEIVDVNIHSVKDATAAEEYNYSANRGSSSSVLIKFRREVGATDYGEESTGNLDESPAHRTVFIGLPSTEIDGVQIVGESVNVQEVVEQILASGQYIPVYNRNDQLILTPDQFQEATGIPVEPSSEIALEQSEAQLKLSKQIPRLGNSMLRFAQKSQAYTDQFAGRIGGSNARYTNRVAYNDSAVFLTPEQPGKPSKVSVPLSGGRQLHVWDRVDGSQSLFISSLDATSRPVTDQEVGALRHEIATSVNTQRQKYAETRAKTKKEEFEAAASAPIFG